MVDNTLLNEWVDLVYVKHQEALNIFKFAHLDTLKQVLKEDSNLDFVKSIGSNILLCEKNLSAEDFSTNEDYEYTFQLIQDIALGIDTYKDEKITNIDKIVGKYFNNWTSGKTPIIIINFKVIGLGNNSRVEFMNELIPIFKDKLGELTYISKDTYSSQGHIEFVHKEITYIMTFKPEGDLTSSSKTDTDQKELLVMLLSQIDIVLEPLTKDNFNYYVTQIVSQFNLVTGVDEQSKEKLRIWLNNVENKPYVRNLINDSILIAGEINDTYNLKDDYEMDRFEIYNTLRSIIELKFKLVPDKWCSADLLLIKKSERERILKILNKINLLFNDENRDKYLKIINNLFGNYGESTKSLIGISLKTTTSRYGTGKGHIKSLSDYKSSRYYINKFEKNFDYVTYSGELFDEIRQTITTKTNKLSIEYDCDFTPILFNNIKLKAKYGNLKLLNFIIDVIEENQNYNILADLIKYTLSISENNPPFVILKGIHKSDLCQVIIINKDLVIDNITKLTILDKSTTQTITLVLECNVGGSDSTIYFIITNSGSSQPTINITNIEWKRDNE